MGEVWLSRVEDVVRLGATLVINRGCQIIGKTSISMQTIFKRRGLSGNDWLSVLASLGLFSDKRALPPDYERQARELLHERNPKPSGKMALVKPGR